MAMSKKDIQRKSGKKKAKLEELSKLAASGSKDALFSANTLNAYVHNPDFNPQPLYLKTTWNNMEKFMKVIWS